MLEYHSHDYPDTANVARTLGLTGGEGICFLLDAFDEYSPQIPTHSDYIYQLIKGVKLPNAAFIMTSRPNASYHLRQYFTRNIEIIGFFEHQIQQYISALPTDNAAIISEYLNRHVNIKYVIYLPLHLAMVTYLAFHSKRVSLADLDTDTRIYHMFVNLTFRQRYKDVENLDKIHSQAFTALSKTAFDATTRSSHSESGLRLHHLDHNLRAKIESFSILTINQQQEGDKLRNIFTFSHHTFQEFFAGYYLTALPHKKQMEALKRYQNASLLMWRFFFGLLRDNFSSETTTKLFERFADIHLSSPLIGGEHAVHKCAYELKHTAIAEVLLRVLNHTVSVKYVLDLSSDCTAFAYALSSHFKKLRILYFLFLEDYWLACFASELPKDNGIVHLSLDGPRLTDRTASVMVRLLLCFPNLQQLELLNVHEPEIPEFPMTSTVAAELETLMNLRHLEIKIGRPTYGGLTAVHKFTVLTEVLAHFIHLEHLTLTGTRVEHVKTVATSLRRLTKLQYLNLTGKSIYPQNILEQDAKKMCYLNERDNEAVAVTEQLKNRMNRYLDLGNYIGDDGIVAVAEGLLNAVNLQSLDISWNNIGDDGAMGVAKGVQNALNLQHLDLSWNKIGIKGTLAVAERLKNAVNLQYLALSWNSIGDDGALAIADGLRNAVNLQYLDLSQNNIGDRGIEGLANVLKRLTHLDLSCNETVVKRAKLARSLKHLSSLQTLKLNMNRIGDDGVAALAKVFKHLTSLQVLELNGNRVGADGAAELAESIKQLTSLQVLGLSANTIGTEGTTVLARSIKHLTSLQALELSGNKIGDDGVAALAEGIQHLTSLQVLGLSANTIGAEGITVLARSIKHLTSLQVLELSRNKIGDDGVAALAEGIQHLTSLQVLELDDSEIGNVGVAALSRGLKHLTSLKVLRLSWNEICDWGAAKLAEETKHLNSLESLSLIYNNICEKGVARTKLVEAVKTGWTGLTTLEVWSYRDLSDIKPSI